MQLSQLGRFINKPPVMCGCPSHIQVKWLELKYLLYTLLVPGSACHCNFPACAPRGSNGGWRMEDCLGFTSRTNSLTNIERSSFAGKLLLILDILIFKSEISFFDDFIFQCTSFTSKTHLASFFGSHSRKDPRYTWVGSVWDVKKLCTVSISSLDTEWRCGCVAVVILYWEFRTCRLACGSGFAAWWTHAFLPLKTCIFAPSCAACAQQQLQTRV